MIAVWYTAHMETEKTVYRAVVHRDPEGGYWAEVPNLLGLVTEADSLDELVSALDEAVKGWLEAGAKRNGGMNGHRGPARVGTLELAA
jgi:predicted RNase H-like HicB family nuclease